MPQYQHDSGVAPHDRGCLRYAMLEALFHVWYDMHGGMFVLCTMYALCGALAQRVCGYKIWWITYAVAIARQHNGSCLRVVVTQTALVPCGCRMVFEWLREPYVAIGYGMVVGAIGCVTAEGDVVRGCSTIHKAWRAWQGLATV